MPVKGLPSPEDICRIVRKTSPRVCVSFSCGKDSVAMWCVLRNFFQEILPVYRYIVPDLEFVEESLSYYERFFGVRIRRVPSAWLWRALQGRIFQTPESYRNLNQWSFYSFRPAEACKDVLEDEGWSISTPIAEGWRASDELARLMVMKRMGWKCKTRGTFWPLASATKAELVSILCGAGVKLPVDYRLWGRSFDCARGWYMPAIKQHFPRDYAKILDWFPMLEVEQYRWN